MKVLGQELSVIQNQVEALYMNIFSWLLTFLPPHLRPRRKFISPSPTEDGCVAIQGPGGLDRLQVIKLETNSRRATIGYNIPGLPPPFVDLPENLESLPDDLVLVKVHYFSVNYADVCIRWGLYESALRYVGWPIVPGFDFSGTVEWAGKSSGFKKDDSVFGFTLFGSYSSLLLAPGRQIRRVPILQKTGKLLAMDAAAALPAVAATALHAIALSGGWPQASATRSRAVLVHSAAGGVGGMLVQMLKEQGYSPIVGVVGSKHKVQFCKDLGAHVVIDKSRTRDLWAEAKKISPEGYVAIFDANGVETIGESYEALSRCGRLVIYGFHSNLPKASHLLSPLQWVKMIYRVAAMPKFDPMAMVLDSRGILGFNLSFFSEEYGMIEKYFTQIMEWIEQGKIVAPSCSVWEMNDIGKAHEAIQSGSTVGKLVIRVPNNAK